MLTSDDIKSLMDVFATKAELQEMCDEMATKEELRKVMGLVESVFTEVKNMREEQHAHFEEHSSH